MLKLRKLSVLMLAMLFSVASFGQDCVAPSDLQITFFGEDDNGNFVVDLEASSTGATNYVVDYFVDGVFQNSQESSDPPTFSFIINPENVVYSFTITAFCDGEWVEGVTLVVDATDPSTSFDCPLPTNVTVEASVTQDNSIDIAWTIPDGTEGVMIDYYNDDTDELISSFLSDGIEYTLLIDTGICIHRVEIYTDCGGTKSPIYKFVITTVDDIKGTAPPKCCEDYWKHLDRCWLMLCTLPAHVESSHIYMERNFVVYEAAYKSNFKVAHLSIIDTSLICLILDFTKNPLQDIKEMSLYPNPVQDMLCLEYLVEKTTRMSLSVFDISGNKVTDLLVDDLQHIGEQDLKFSLPDLPVGIYFVQLNTGLEQQSFKFIKQ